MKLRKILVPVDGSALAEGAVGEAVALARDSGATVVLLRAAEAHTLPGVDPTDAQVEVVREAEDYVSGLKARLGETGFSDVETSVWYGPPAPAIIEAAKLQRIDMIVMTTHGRSGLGRIILGSVAESVLRGSDTPILLLRAAGAPLEAPRGAGQARPRETARV
jgi:nucleotide-binding universal stress UspA family protein